MEQDKESNDNQGDEEDDVDEQTTKIKEAMNVQLEEIEIPQRLSCLHIVYSSQQNMA